MQLQAVGEKPNPTFKGFRKEVKGTVVYLVQNTKKSISKDRLKKLLKKLVLRKIIGNLGLVDVVFVIISPFKERPASALERALPVGIVGIDPETESPISANSGVACSDIAKLWYRAFIRRRNIITMPALTDCLIHSSFCPVSAEGLLVHAAGKLFVREGLDLDFGSLNWCGRCNDT